MSNIVDDLLQDIEEINANTQDMNENVQNVEQQKARLSNQIQADSNRVLLETSKITQEAAKQSHLAATTSIKVAEQLKARNSELEEHSNNWRQAVRNILRDQNGAKKYFSIMMGTTLAVNIITLSALGYFFYLMNQQNAQQKNDVLDIIQTENALLSNKLTMQSDQMASLTEAMSADVKKLAQGQNGVAYILPSPSMAATKEKTQKTPLPTQTTQPVKKSEHNKDSEHINTLNAQYSELKTLIQTVIKKQQQLEIRPVHKKENKQSHNPSSEQLKKLNDLNWLVRKQGKALKAIQKTLSNRAPNNANTSTASNKQLQKTLQGLKIELNDVNLQQNTIQKQIQTLQDNFSKYTQKPPKKPPYSYKSTKEYDLN